MKMIIYRNATPILVQEVVEGATIPAIGDKVVLPRSADVFHVERRVWGLGTPPLDPTTVALYVI